MFVQQLLGYLSSLPDTVNIGIIWGLMALGVFITYKVLDIADLTVDGSFIVGGVVCAVYMDNGGNFAVGLLLGFVSGVLCGFPNIFDNCRYTDCQRCILLFPENNKRR